jgi:hypothetical protein
VEAKAEALEEAPDLPGPEAAEDGVDDGRVGRRERPGGETFIEEIAAAAARSQKLLAGPGKPLEEDDLGSPSCAARRGDEAGRPGADDRQIEAPGH